MTLPFYASNLVPAAQVEHGYKNVWVRDNYYMGICSGEEDKKRIWSGLVDILDNYKWKLELHSKQKPHYWYEYIHVRYSTEGKEIDEHWLHNQWDSIGNWIEICVEMGRLDLAELLVDYLKVISFWNSSSAGAWEDRSEIDAYSIASCLHALYIARDFLNKKQDEIDMMISHGLSRLNSLLPYATPSKQICLSLLGIIWPFDLAGIYKDQILDLVIKNLKRDPFGFIRYPGDNYDGQYHFRYHGNETPWLLGDCFMAMIEPSNKIWINRLDKAFETFNCMPEAYFPENMKSNRNTPLLWAEAMYTKIKTS